MVKKLTLLFLFIFSLGFLRAQHPPCGPGGTPSDNCSDVCVLCDIGEIEGYVGSSSTYTPDLTNISDPAEQQGGSGPFCSGIQNNQWIAFMAGATNVSMRINVGNCTGSTGPASGMQAIIMSGFNCSGFQSVSNCFTQIAPGSFGTLSAGGLTIGSLYYIMLDGLSGSECDFTITNVTGVSDVNVGPLNTITGPLVLCPNSTATYTIPNVSGAAYYEWSIPPGATINGDPGPVTLPASTGKSVTIVFGDNPAGQICVTPSNACNTGTPKCINITKKVIPPTNLPPIKMCFTDCHEWIDDNVYCNSQNLTTTIITNAGCDSVVNQQLIRLPQIINNLPLVKLCEGECFEAGGFQYCDPGQHTALSTSEVPPYCDSLIKFTIVKSNLVLATNVTNATCGISNGQATVSATGGVGTLTYKWSTTPVKTTATVTGLGAGTYSVTVTDGFLCSKETSVTITNSVPTVVATIDNHASCFNICDGKATVVASNGATPYTYLWSNGQTTATATGLCDGIQNVTVTDASGCINTANVTINEPAQINLVTNITNDKCNKSIGQACVVASGGNGPYTYLWSNAQITDCINNITANTYSVTVKDASNCTSNTSAIVNNTPAGSAAIVVDNHISCNGLCDGKATVTMTGGTAPFTYLWDNGSTTATVSNLCVGNHSVTVTDGNTCEANASTTINQPIVLSLSTSSTNSDCGQANGQACVTPIGGTAPYTYLWDNAQTTGCITVVAGTYHVTITDAHNCSANTSVIVGNNASGSASININSQVTCNGLCNGNATVNVSGGTTPFTYLWDNGSITSTVSNLCAGNHSVSVTDGNNCVMVATTTITEPLAIILNTNNVNANCNLADGNACVVPSGGTTPYTYLWSNGKITDCITDVPATYQVTVTDANTCSANISVTIGNNPAGNALINVDNQVLCNGNCDGKATVAMTGGTSPYTYLWSNGQTTITATGLCIGSHSVTVTDTKGCLANSSINITEPLAISLAPSSVNATCNQATGQACVTPTGGTGAYTYLWDNAQTTSCATGVAAGTYSVTVTDVNNCNKSTSVIVNNNNSGVISAVVDKQVSCNGLCDGKATASIVGGTGPFTYLWDNGSTTAIVSNLCVGNHTVSITDANNCTVNTFVVITEPTVIAAPTTSVNTKCNLNNGEACVTPTGGTSPYTYLWDAGQVSNCVNNFNAANHFVTVTDANLCTKIVNVVVGSDPVGLANIVVNNHVSCNGLCDGKATASIIGGVGPYTYLWDNGKNTNVVSDFCAGNYVVSITDANNCVVTTNAVITEPTTLTFVTNTLNANCGESDGQACIVPNGGTSPYSYSWSNGKVTSCNTGVLAGDYSVTVTDSRGCEVNTLISVINNNTGTPNTSIVKNPSCTGKCDGEATVSMVGGTGPFTYLWSNGQATISATGLCANSYSVTVTDANNCIVNSSITLIDPPIMLLNTNTVSANCNQSDGKACVTPIGGTSPYTYLWDNGQTGSCATSIPKGTYTVTVTDAGGCSSSIAVLVGNGNAGIASINVDKDVSCNGLCDGQATVSIIGGTSPFTYLWDNTLTTKTVNNLCVGAHTVTVTDANGCVVDASSNISEPTEITINSTSTNANCSQSNGQACVTPTGGTSPYTYLWDNGQTSNCANNVAAGTYVVTVTDANSCLKTVSVNVNNNNTGTPSVIIDNDVSCNAGCNGKLTASILGGMAPFSYKWNDTQQQPTISATGLCAGNYTVFITDANGCIVSASATINEPSAIELLTATTGETCLGDCKGTATISASGGSPVYLFSIDNGTIYSSNNLFNNLCAGQYNVVVKDNKGCKAFALADVAAGITTNIVIDPIIDPCVKETSIQLTATPIGGTWSGDGIVDPINGIFNPSKVAAGIHVITYSNLLACASDQSININVLPIQSILVKPIDPLCFDDPSITLSANMMGGIWSGPGVDPLTGVFSPNIAGIGEHNIEYDVPGVCVEKQTIQIKVGSILAPNFTSDIIDGCEPLTVRFENTTNGDPADCKWKINGIDIPGNCTSFPHIFNKEGLYDVTLSLTSKDGCENSLSINDMIHVYPMPLADFFYLHQSITSIVQQTQLLNKSIDADSYSWNLGPLGHSLAKDPVLFFDENGIYTICLDAINEYGCVDTSCKNIKIVLPIVFNIPNTYTPNKDGYNENFYPVFNDTEGIENYKFSIFNRWGDIIFTTENIKEVWDGSVNGLQAPIGVYVWKIQYKDPFDKQLQEKIGKVSLLR